MYWRLFLGGWLLALPAWGQAPLMLPGKLPSPQVDIGPYTAFYKDVSGDTLPLETVRRQTFRPFAQKANERTHPTPYTVLVTWLQFTLHNTHPTDTLKLLHYTGRHGLISLYNNTRLIGQTGISLPPQRRPSRFALFLTLPPGTQRTYYVRVVDYAVSPTPVSSKLLTIQASIDAEFGPQALGRNILLVAMSILTGCLLFMGLYASYSGLLTHDWSFLYYALYTLVCVLFALNCVDSGFGFSLLFPRRMVEGSSPFSFNLIAFFYTLFMAEISAMKLQFPRTWQVIRVLLVLVSMLVVVNAVEWSYARPLFYDYRLFDYVQTTPAVLITGLLVVALFRSRSPIRYYLIVGLLSMVGIGFVYSLLDVYVEDGSPVANAFINYPYFWIVLCLSIEAFCFLLALSRRSYLIEVEKNQIQQQLIDQLKENGRLQQDHTVDLERQLAQRTTEVLIKAHELEDQRVSQLQSDFVRRIAEAEMAGLRSQMNPHFIFNCLNSIKLYATENDSEKASEYLTKFSRLIRMVLENSRSERVTLRNELDMLQLYADMEIMRFKQKLSFSVAVEPGIDAQFIEIPPLLLQPYVENAIWHGLMHKFEGGTVHVRATQPQENLLQLTITDDGVGRARAAEIRSKSASHRKSFGLKMTSERIALVNQLYQTNTQVTIEDLVDADGQPAGTEVVIQIPL